ncbi:MAG TPA: hypothetical protein PKD61_35205 [Polyangiaceae bacterium]|nr:hypothetical protein [Polyangiaceae bacterium]
MQNSDQTVTCSIPLPDESRDTWLDELGPPASSSGNDLIIPPPPRWSDEPELEMW